MMVDLYPPIAVIRAGLFGHTEPVAEGNEDPALAAVDFAAAGASEPPAFLKNLIARKVAADHAFAGRIPLARGQIRRLARVGGHSPGTGRPLQRALGVLLGAHLGQGRWLGWLVAQEADYAGDRDLVLEESDGPCAPEAALVQCWNPVELFVDGSAAVLAILTPARMLAVMTLASGGADATAAVLPRPGRLGARDLDGAVVVTGTPLADEADPRHAYRQLYGELANEIRDAVRQPGGDPIGAGQAGWLERWRRFFSRPALGMLAVALLVVQTLWLWGPGHEPEAEVYRGASYNAGEHPCAGAIRIVFKPGTALSEIILLVRKADTSIAQGPSETGEFWLRVPVDRHIEETLALLKSSAYVETADIATLAKPGCEGK